MDCPKGSILKETQHEVKTLDTAKEWFAGVQNYDLPIRITQRTAENGRCMITVFDNNGKKIHQRG